MTLSRRAFLQLSGLTALGMGAAGMLAFPRTAQAQSAFATIDHALLVLNRATWGARPEDRARIAELGVEGYLDWQLDYNNIPDPLIDQFVGARRVLTMEIEDLLRLGDDIYTTGFDNALWGRIYRAAYSERQLFERLVEFWTDHFNIPIPDLLADKIVDDREVIRRHALGNFRDLLLASAQSGAMLDYLDNDVSSAEHPNENYARELMELHTLGVDGGYTEQDVTEVARALTGWTVSYQNRRFLFNPDMHDYGEKTVLGVTLPADRGIEDGLQVVDILANHPSTARYISRKLCHRFVSDAAPDSLVDSTTDVFNSTRGDIRAVVRHIFTSAEFAISAGQKFRRPLEAVVAMIRALQPGIQVDSYYTLFEALNLMGQLPYHWFPPNGYPDAAGAWLNTNGLLHRWNTALTLALAGDGYTPGVSLNMDAVIPYVATAGELVDAAAERLLGYRLPDTDRAHLLAYVSRDANPDAPLDERLRYDKLPGVVGLILASPYFQWI